MLTGSHYLKLSVRHGTPSYGSGCGSDISFLKAVHDKFDSDGDYSNGKLVVAAHSTEANRGSMLYKIDKSLIR